MRYNSYCSNVTRTYLIDPSKEKEGVYKKVAAVHEFLVGEMKPGVSCREVYEKAVKKGGEVGVDLGKNVGFMVWFFCLRMFLIIVSSLGLLLDTITLNSMR